MQERTRGGGKVGGGGGMRGRLCRSGPAYSAQSEGLVGESGGSSEPAVGVPLCSLINRVTIADPDEEAMVDAEAVDAVAVSTEAQ